MFPSSAPVTLGIIAGNGAYPRALAQAARAAGVKKIIAAAFTNETDPALTQHVDLVEWLRVGQLNRLLKFFREQQVRHAIMAGQIAPKNLFDLRPDWKALLLLAKLKERNAESIFCAIANELAKVDVDLLPATSFLEDQLAPAGLIAGPKLSRYRSNRSGEKRNRARGGSIRGDKRHDQARRRTRTQGRDYDKSCETKSRHAF